MGIAWIAVASFVVLYFVVRLALRYYFPPLHDPGKWRGRRKPAISFVLSKPSSALIAWSGILLDAYLAGSKIDEDPLTLREREVLQLVGEGKTTKEIAQSLGVTPKTAEAACLLIRRTSPSAAAHLSIIGREAHLKALVVPAAE